MRENKENFILYQMNVIKNDYIKINTPKRTLDMESLKSFVSSEVDSTGISLIFFIMFYIINYLIEIEPLKLKTKFINY